MTVVIPASMHGVPSRDSQSPTCKTRVFKVLASLGLLSNKIITSESPQTVEAWHRNAINVYYYYLNAFQALC